MTLVNVLVQNKPFVIVNSNNIDWFEVTFIPENGQVAELKEKIELLCNQFKEEVKTIEVLTKHNRVCVVIDCNMDNHIMIYKFIKSLYDGIVSNNSGQTIQFNKLVNFMNDNVYFYIKDRHVHTTSFFENMVDAYSTYDIIFMDEAEHFRKIIYNLDIKSYFGVYFKEYSISETEDTITIKTDYFAPVEDGIINLVKDINNYGNE